MHLLSLRLSFWQPVPFCLAHGALAHATLHRPGACSPFLFSLLVPCHPYYIGWGSVVPFRSARSCLFCLFIVFAHSPSLRGRFLHARVDSWGGCLEARSLHLEDRPLSCPVSSENSRSFRGGSK